MHIPVSPQEITTQWLTDALSAHTDGAKVHKIAVEDIGEGTGIFGEIARLAISYEEPADSPPDSVVVKLPCTEPENLAVAQALGIYKREVRFFNEIASSTPLRVPRCYHSDLSDDGAFVLVLEDLNNEFEVGDQVVGATVSQAEDIIDALAKLHAAWWEHDDLDELTWLPEPNSPEYLAAVPAIYSAGLPVLEADWADRLPHGAVPMAQRLEPRFVELIHRMASGPRTFAHSDTRLDNLFFARDGSGDVAFIDFQLSLRQRGAADIAYLIGSSMDAALSSANWETLLRRWHTGLVSAGVTSYSWDDCVTHYTESALYYLCGAMSLIGSFDTGNERGAAMATAYTTRIFTHVLDINAIDVL